jgi:alcohol dehydrogenase, propanol-preferring
MKAAIVREFKQPLQVEEIPAPAPGPDEVLIKVEACGVCHSDLHLADGDWPQLAKIIKKPLIPGHEVVGRVVDRGSAVSQPGPGVRVGVPWIHWTCGECELCKEGRENLCLAQMITGATVDGGFAEFLKAKASHVVQVPESLDSIEAAPLFCAGVTVYRAIKNAGIRPGQRVAVFGIGGLGHLAVQIAAQRGSRVIAIDIAQEKLELALSLGAERIFNSSTTDVRKELRAMGGAHFALVTSAAKAAYELAFGSLRRGGTLLVIGVPAEPLSIPVIAMVGAETRILSSSVGTREDLRETLELAAAGKIRCRVETRRLDQINQVFDAMRRGTILGRAVLAM